MSGKKEQEPARYELHSELAQMCLPAAQRDRNQKLAWVNSLCFLYVTIGLIGLKPPALALREVPPLEEPIITVIETPPPAQENRTDQPDEVQENTQESQDTPQVVVVVPDAPSISFSVPTIGNVLVTKGNVAALPPAEPMRFTQPVPTNRAVLNLRFTGRGGSFPQPDYPQWALKEKMQGVVVLRITVDATGEITEVEIEKSCGHAQLDRHTITHIRRRFTFPPGEGERVYRLPVDYSPI